MNFSNIFHYSYFFDTALGNTFMGYPYVLAGLIVLLIASAIVSYKAGKWNYIKRMVAIRLTRVGFMVSWFGLAFVWFRFENIPYLSMRMWPTILFIYVIVELVMLVKFVRIDYPKNRAKKKGLGEKDLYLRKFLGK